MTFALCTGALTVDNAKAPEWIELLPAGETIAAVDGRSWKSPGADQVIRASASKLPLAIDYDHATDRPVDGAKSSRASGWVDRLENRGGAVWGHVDWTDAGGKAVAAKEYRYLSPVFTFTKTGNVIGALLRAALVNDPALTQLTALASQQENSLDELKKIAAALGLPDTATAADIIAKITAMNGVAANCTTAHTRLGLIATAAALSTTGDKLSDAEITGICTKLKVAPATGNATIDELQKEVATLSAQLKGQTATQKVEAAMKEGKIAPAQKEWAIGYCTRDPEGFDKFAASQPVIVGGRVNNGGAKDGELSDEEKATCAALGVTEEDFKKTAKTMKGTA